MTIYVVLLTIGLSNKTIDGFYTCPKLSEILGSDAFLRMNIYIISDDNYTSVLQTDVLDIRGVHIYVDM